MNSINIYNLYMFLFSYSMPKDRKKLYKYCPRFYNLKWNNSLWSPSKITVLMKKIIIKEKLKRNNTK